MKLPALSEFQFKELAKYWFDLSKLTFVSLILKFFEPEARLASSFSFLTIVFGLTAAAGFVIVGLYFAKGVETK